MAVPVRPFATLIGPAVLVLLLLSACNAIPLFSASPLLAGVNASPATITPNGDQPDAVRETRISYDLAQPASVTITLIDAQGQSHQLRAAERRAAGSYQATFAGTVKPDPAGISQQVLPDGEYTYVVTAETFSGQTSEQRGTLTIDGADTRPLEVLDLVALPATITPNGDAREDRSVISYELSKDAEVEIYATDEAGQRYLIEPPTQRLTGLHSREWNGFSGGILAPNGAYTVHVVARDSSGNITEAVVPVSLAEGGTPDLQILEVEFSPPTVPYRGEVQVKIRVKNTGDTPIHTKGPPPGTAFTTETNYFLATDAAGQPKYFDEAGKWRVAVSWNQAPRQYPARWALTKPVIGPNGEEEYPPLLPGEESVITGTIQVLYQQVDELHFWASYEKGAIGFGPIVGQQRIGVSRP